MFCESPGVKTGAILSGGILLVSLFNREYGFKHYGNIKNPSKNA